MTRWLVTGAAGFIGFHVARRLTGEGDEVVGVDNLNAYYDPGLKKARLAQLADEANFSFRYIDPSDPSAVNPGWTRADPDPASSWHPWRLYNIGHGEQVTVNRLIELLEGVLDRPAQRIHVDERPGDVPATHADTTDFEHAVAFRPKVSIEEGLDRFAEWLVSYRSGK